MFCSECGKEVDQNSAFCIACGNPIKKPTAPPVAPPIMPVAPSNSQSAAPIVAAPIAQSGAPPMREPSQQQYIPQPVHIVTRPYKTEYVLGLIGAIIGAVMFLIIVLVGIDELTMYISSFFALISFVLGFIGMALLRKGNVTGGIMLVIGGGFGFIAMFISYIGPITLFSFPLILAGGIVALARRKRVEQNFPRQ